MAEKKKKPAPERPDLITAKQLCRLCGISVPTLYRHLKYGAPMIRRHGAKIDVGQVPYTWVGGRRFWSRSAAKQLIKEALERSAYS